MGHSYISKFILYLFRIYTYSVKTYSYICNMFILNFLINSTFLGMLVRKVLSQKRYMCLFKIFPCQYSEFLH